MYFKEFIRLLKLDYPVIGTQNNGYLGGKYKRSPKDNRILSDLFDLHAHAIL